MPIATLLVNGFDETYVNWLEYGSSPYLDIDDGDTNSIKATYNNQGNEGLFSFQDPNANWIITQVQMYFVIKANSGGGLLNVYNQFGSQLVTQLNISGNGQYQLYWRTVYLKYCGTFELLRDLKIRINASIGGSSDYIQITQIYLNVTYLRGQKIKLNVDGFDETYTEWAEVGSSPYLHSNDGDTSYIRTTTPVTGLREGYFTFQNPTQEINILNVKLCIVTKIIGANCYYAIDVYKQGNVLILDNISMSELDGKYNTYVWDITSHANTYQSLCDLKIYVKESSATSGAVIRITHVYLEVGLPLSGEATLDDVTLGELETAERILEFIISEGVDFPKRDVRGKTTPTIQAEMYVMSPKTYKIVARVDTDKRDLLQGKKDLHTTLTFIFGTNEGETDNVKFEEFEYRWAGNECFECPWLVTITLVSTTK